MTTAKLSKPTATGCCRYCSWHTVPVDLEVAKGLSIAHVMAEHPDDYRDATGKEPLNLEGSFAEIELEVFTAR